MKFRSVLILLLMVRVVVPEGSRANDCRNRGLVELGNCTNNSRIQILKDAQNYQLRLCPSEQQCTTVTAIDMSLNWIRCRDICDACRSLLGPNRKNATSNMVQP